MKEESKSVGEDREKSTARTEAPASNQIARATQLCSCQTITGGAVARNDACPVHGYGVHRFRLPNGALVQVLEHCTLCTSRLIAANGWGYSQQVTLYRGDAWEILPFIREAVAVVSDQPYGTGWVKGGGAVGVFHAKHEKAEWDKWDTSWISLIAQPVAGAVFGPFSRASDLRAEMPKPNQNVWWHKTNPRPNGPDRKPICVWPAHLPTALQWSAYNGDTPLHPNQKPLVLMIWVLGFVPDSLTVLDPFAGSGTTLVAAKMLGRRAIGIEASAAYCEIAAQRLSQNVLGLGGAA